MTDLCSTKDCGYKDFGSACQNRNKDGTPSGLPYCCGDLAVDIQSSSCYSTCGENEKPPCPSNPPYCIKGLFLGKDGRCHDFCGDLNTTCCAEGVVKPYNLNDSGCRDVPDGWNPALPIGNHLVCNAGNVCKIQDQHTCSKDDDCITNQCISDETEESTCSTRKKE